MDDSQDQNDSVGCTKSLKIRLDKQTLVESSQNNEFNNHKTSAEKPYNSNKYEAPSSNLRKTENHKNQTHAQKAQERARTERRISKPDNQKNIETTQSTRGVQRSD